MAFQSQVCFTKLSVCDHQQEDALAVDGDEDLTQRQAVNPSRQHLFQISLRLCMHLKRIQTIEEIATDMVINDRKLSFLLCLNHVLLLLLELVLMWRVTLSILILLLAIVTLVINGPLLLILLVLAI